MKKRVAVLASLVLCSSPLSAVAEDMSNLSVPTHDGKHYFEILNDKMENYSAGTWTPLTTPPGAEAVFYACQNPVSNQNTPVQNRSFMADSNCTDYALFVPGTQTLSTDLNNATVNSTVNDPEAPNYDPSVHGSHIVLLAPQGDGYFVWTSSVEPGQNGETTGSYSHDGNVSLGFSGTIATVETGLWTPRNDKADEGWTFVACPNPVSASTTVYSALDPLTQDENCSILSVTAPTPARPTDFSSAQILTDGGIESYDSMVHPNEIVLISSLDRGYTSGSGKIVWSDSVTYTGNTSTPPAPPAESESSNDQPFQAPSPFQGPVIDSTDIPSTNTPGSTITIGGENLDDVIAISLGGEAAEFELADGSMEITIPESLESGNYDFVVSSSSGNVTISDAVNVAGFAFDADEGPRGSTIRMGDEVKVRFFNPVDAGKLQVFVNDEEIAWIDTNDANDPKLHLGYLVRTVNLQPGKNAFEFYVEGERIRRTAYWMD